MKKYYYSSLGPRLSMCTYISFFRTSLHSADSKCQISHRWSKNGSECTSLCAPKVIQELNLKKIFFEQLYTGWIVVVHLCFDFSLWRQMAPQQSAKFWTAFFGQFCTSLRKDSIANYASIWTLFTTSVTCFVTH